MNPLLAQVLASGEHYVAASIGAAGIKQRHLVRIEDFDQFAEQCNNEGLNAYFALSTFKQGWYVGPDQRKHLRTADNTCRQKCLWLELDVGPNKPHKTAQDALAALETFTNTIGLPTPTTVFSGGGVHVYWPFTEEVETNTWQVMADGLHALTIQHNLQADPARTCDAASVLRIPGTYNYKEATPRAVQINYLGSPSSTAKFYEILSAVPRIAPVVSPLLTIDVSNIKLPSNLPLIPIPLLAPSVPQDAQLVIDGCAQIRQQDGAQEPIWRGMLSVISRCDNGVARAHELSAQDPRYTEAGTDLKLQQIDAAGSGPYLCSTFDGLRPGICGTCKYWGQLKSPMALSTLVSPVTPTPMTVEKEGRIEEVTVPPLPIKLAKRYEMTPDHGCVLVTRAKSGDGWQTQRHCFREYPVYPIHVLYHYDAKMGKTFHYIWRFHDAEGYEDVTIEGSVMAASQTLRSRISEAAGIGFVEIDWKIMGDFMRAFLEQVKGQLPKSEIRHNLGWDVGYTQFVLGTKIYENGGATEIIVEGEADALATLTQPKGRLDLWKRAAASYNRAGMEWAQVVVCSAFASPLMGLGAVEKAALLCVSGKRGHGKSLAQQVALAVYGSPTMLMPLSDTPTARIHKLGIANSIAVAMDELTDMKSAQASEFVYTIPAGKGKARMTQGGTGLLDNNTRWSTLPTISMNGSVVDILAQHSSDASAQMTRVLELVSTDPKEYFNFEEMEQNKYAIQKIFENYGHAGDAYIRYVTKHMGSIVDMMLKYEQYFTRKTRLSNTERFWPYMAVRLIIGGTIAKCLGLIDYDMNVLEDYIISQINAMQRQVTINVQDPSSWLGDFRASFAPNILRVTQQSRPRTRPDGSEWRDDVTIGAANDVGYVVFAPENREIVGRYVVESDELFLRKSAVKNWCVSNKIPMTMFLDELDKRGLLFSLAAKRQKRDIGAGTRFRGLDVTVIYIRGAQALLTNGE